MATSTNTSQTPQTYEQVKTQLLSHTHTFTSLPTGPHRPHIPSNHIAGLQLHPVLEALLHLLNLDLPSAHFLVRHMEAKPAEESMFVHGMLHRVEGDYGNSRAWYSDVDGSEVFRSTWAIKDEAFQFIDGVEKWRKGGQVQGREEERLREKSLAEITTCLEFCEKKFGTERVLDASTVWVKKEKTKEQAEKMIMGGEGWREF